MRTIYKKIISIIIFLALLYGIYASATYLFRNSDHDRMSVTGIKEEKPLDMVYIGASAAYVYWQPLKAWKDCGFTSYLLSASGLQAESIKYYVKQALKDNPPELFVIGVRPYQLYKGYRIADSPTLRHSSDSMDIGLDRMRLVWEYLKNHKDREKIEVNDELSYYLDIMKYHTNYDALSSVDNWGMIDNSYRSDTKGYELLQDYMYLEESKNFQTEERAAEDAGTERLYELLDFCRDNKVKKILFVVCPYQIDKGDYEQYNTIKDAVTSYGYDFLNVNDYYDEMGIDFSKDFINSAHVNVFGAEKYTKFLEEYIEKYYKLADHREEEEYDSWNEDYKLFSKQEEEAKQITGDMIASSEDSRKIADILAVTDDFPEWANMVKDPHFTVIAAGAGEMTEMKSVLDKRAMQQLGLDTSDEKNSIKVISGDETIYSNKGKDEYAYENTIGIVDITNDSTTSECSVKNTGNEKSVVIDGKEYCNDEEGLHIVVFENDYHYVVDSVVLKYNDDSGRIELVR